MAEVILQKAGFNKEKTAEKYSGITGINMEEARKAIESVVQGNKIILTVPDAQNVPFVIQQFSEVGAVAIENTESMSENAENNAVQERETIDKNEQYEIAEQETGEEVVEGEVVETLELGVTMVDLDDISNAGRNIILPVLDDVCKVSEHIDNLARQVKDIEAVITKIKNKSNQVSYEVSSPLSAKIIGIISGLICSFIIFYILLHIDANDGEAVIMFCLCGGICAGIWTTKKVSLFVNADVIQAQKNEYLKKYLPSNLEKEKKLKEMIEEYLSSAEVYWAVNVVGEEYFNTEVIKKLASLITSRRADSLKEALNLYETIKYQENMQNMQSSILELANAGVQAAKEQAEYAKQIEQNTAVAAMAAVANANANAANAKANASRAATAKKIYKEIKK